MIKCPFCGAMQVANTIFCSECGVYLLEDERRSTEVLETEQFQQLEQEDEAAINSKADKLSRGPSTLCLVVGESARRIEANLNHSLYLGRLDPASDMFPEIDLTDDNGLEKGVSRRHARILKRDGNVVVEDLGSINGTFINGRRIAPYLPEILKDGDQLQLGNLLIEVELS